MTEYFDQNLIVRTAKATVVPIQLGVQSYTTKDNAIETDTGVFDKPSVLVAYTNSGLYDLSATSITTRRETGYTCTHTTMSSLNDSRSMRLGICVSSTQRNASVLCVDHASAVTENAYGEARMVLPLMDYNIARCVVDKLQIYTKPATVANVTNTSIILVTGITLRNTGGRNDSQAYRSFVLARVCNYERDFPECVNMGNTYCTPNGVVLFDHSGVIYMMHADDDGRTARVLKTGFSDDIISANSGLTAVSCMIDVGGKAHWLGWKNGIYKIFQGPSPINGVLGERLTIKGHKFVCLANGPFYARLT